MLSGINMLDWAFHRRERGNPDLSLESRNSSEGCLQNSQDIINCNFRWVSYYNIFRFKIHVVFKIFNSISTKEYTVEQQIFACRKFSWISTDSRKFHAREYYQNTVGVFSFQPDFTDFYFSEIRENFLHANCLCPKFAKISCRENFLFYSNLRSILRTIQVSPK